MKTGSIELRRACGLLVAVGLVLAGILTTHQDTAVGQSADVTITVQDTILGQTTTYIGATEAGVFFIDDLTDLGINAYRLWTKMAELEWWDDDDAKSASPYLCTEIGTPTIAAIKADQASGFANTIPWGWWDEQFTGAYYQWSGKSREQVIQECVNNGITPVLVLRNIDDQGQPNISGCNWAPDSPVDQADLNEWWEHCFAVAYWLNVRHSYGITRFEVLNEPDLASQGWRGTQSEYVQLVQTAYDAVKFANDIAGVDTIIHAPVVANYNSTYIANSLDGADTEIAVVDYHNYDNDPTVSINTVKAAIADPNHNPDGVIEPVWLSEWGTYLSTYDDLNRALLTAEQLMAFSEHGVEGVTIFGMYDWGGFSGLLDMSRNKSETYYAYRLMTRGLEEAKDRLAFTSSGLDSSGRAMVTRDTDYLYIIVKNGSGTVAVDISVVPGYGDTATIYEYSAANKDEIVTASTISNGQFSFAAPASGLSLAQVPVQPPNAVNLSAFTVTDNANSVALEQARGLLIALLAACLTGLLGIVLNHRAKKL